MLGFRRKPGVGVDNMLRCARRSQAAGSFARTSKWLYWRSFLPFTRTSSRCQIIVSGGPNNVSATDNVPAWNAMMLVSRALDPNNGCAGLRCKFGLGHFYFADTIHLTSSALSEVQSPARAGDARTVFWFSNKRARTRAMQSKPEYRQRHWS